MHSLPKSKLMSVITSSKDFTEGHQKRLNFVRRLKDYFGEDIDVFGRGIREVDDKWDAISPYKYHIALENSVYPHYWTEKLGDVYLSGAYPIYYGCLNLEDYFPEAPIHESILMMWERQSEPLRNVSVRGAMKPHWIE